MRHLTRDQLLWLAEDSSRADAHLQRCPRCREDVAALQAVVRRLEQVDVPEPSPLFWGNLSERIGAALAEERGQTRPANHPWGRWLAWAAPLTAAVALGALSIRLFPPPSLDPAVMTEMVGAATTGDADWQLVSDAIGEDDTGVAATLTGVDPGAAEDLVAELSADERVALVSLLQRELDSPRSRGR